MADDAVVVETLFGNQGCTPVDCANPACRHLCGALQWFGNLSTCTVELQYRLPYDPQWHSLGVYESGDHTELGGGALYLPSEAHLRAVRVKPSTTSATATTTRNDDQVIYQWGRVGNGWRHLLVDSNNCEDAVFQITDASNDAAATTATPTGSHARLNTQQTSRTLRLVQILTGILLVVCLVLLVLIARRRRLA